MEPTGFEPVTSCLQTVLAGDRQSPDFQDFPDRGTSERTLLVYRILRTIPGRPGPK